MALIQPVENGQIAENTSSTTSTSNASNSNNDLGYDQFLQILCAEMQYQDPLEPTSNTEYVAQLATFSQLESTLSMQDTIESSSANALVGKYVIMKVTSSTTGETSYVSGICDYVLHQNGQTFLSVNDGLYSLDNLDTVADSEYMEAVTLSNAFASTVSRLPSKNLISLSDQDAIENIREVYESLTAYQKSFIDQDVYNTFTEREDRLKELLKAAEATSGTTDTTTDETTESTDTTDTTDETTDGDTTEA